MKNKEKKKPRKIWKIFIVVFAIMIIGISGFLISVRPDEETSNMLFDVGIFNPISFVAFDGNGYASRVVGNDDTFNVPTMLNISFEPKARTRWHTHDGGQILICTYGTGYYQVEGETAQILRQGDVVMIEPGIKHWHGAGEDGWFSHIAISTGNAGSDFLEHISDEEYDDLHIDSVEFNEREDIGYSKKALADLGKGAMFPLDNSDNFDGKYVGKIYKSTLISNEEKFNFPETLSVVCEPKSRTNWHNSEGGQILIALGGDGYYQIEGEKSVKLNQGDVVKIEPGVNHWYGSDSDSWSSYMIINTNPDKAKTNWGKAIEDNLY